MFTSSQVLLTTCVGSKEELEMLVTAASQFYAKYYQHSGSATPAKVRNIVNMTGTSESGFLKFEK